MRIKELRIGVGLKQKDLAEQVNRSQSCICDWENGRREPSVSDLIKLSELFECSVDYIIGNNSEYDIANENLTNLTKRETDLISSFNLLTEDNQNKVIGFIKALEK